MHVLALLVIVFWPQGSGPSHRFTLHCGPPGGTLPSPSAACTRLAALDAPFAPTPPGSACTQIYGGPQVARVTGRYRGRTVWATFRRRDGCEINRWQRISFLLR